MRNLIFGFVVILLCSCSRVLYDISYKGETNYKEFYIVDTILIESPVRVFSEKYGGMFVLSNEKLKSYDGKIDFFMEPDVFILGFDIYKDLDKGVSKTLIYPDNGGCKLEKSPIEINGLEVYEYPEGVRFVLALISTNRYHVKQNSPVYFNMQIEYSKLFYLKLVYPLCQN